MYSLPSLFKYYKATKYPSVFSGMPGWGSCFAELHVLFEKVANENI